MALWLINILSIAGSLALFIYGMKVMSDGIQKAASGQLRKTLRRVTKRPLSGILVGTITTGIMQSSSATTVMIISFVNAGLITVTQSVGILMGANIGTTITAWIVSFGGFLFKLSSITLPLLTLAIPMYFRGSQRNRYWAEFLIGFALLFIGLDFLKASLPTVENQQLFDAIKNYTSYEFGSRVLFVLVGIVLTLIVQSSSAAMTLTITLVFNGMIPMDLACAMIIGENIGTTVTAELAALIGNVRARRSASVHTLFNIIGAIWMVFLMSPVLVGLEKIMDIFTNLQSAFDSPQYATIGLAAFHTAFNFLNTLLLLPFTGMLVGLASKLRRKRPRRDSSSKLKHINTERRTPELSSVEIEAQLALFGENVYGMAQDCYKILNSTNEDEVIKANRKLQKKDRRNDNLSLSVSQQAIKMVRSELTADTSQKLQRYITISNDLKRISNITVNISFELRDKFKNRIWFTPSQRTKLIAMYDKALKGLDTMQWDLKEGNYYEIDMVAADQLENQINRLRDQYREELNTASEDFDFNMEGSLIYFRLFILLEKMGDKIHDIATAMSLGQQNLTQKKAI